MNVILKQVHKIYPGKIATIKLASGLEIIARVEAIEEKGEFITLSKPKIVVISVDKTAIVPYQYTGDSSSVVLNGSHVVSISESAEESAEDYNLLVNPKESEESPLTADDQKFFDGTPRVP